MYVCTGSLANCCFGLADWFRDVGVVGSLYSILHCFVHSLRLLRATNQPICWLLSFFRVLSLMLGNCMYYACMHALEIV